MRDRSQTAEDLSAGPRPVAVIGAGVAGLVCAYRLGRAGIACDVYERWPGLGGQAATLELADGGRFERYYHHLFTSDTDILDLFAELELSDDLDHLESSAAIAIDGRILPFNGVLDLLRFDPIPLSSRLRMGLGLLQMQLSRKDAADLGQITARAWIERNMGSAVWERVWGPLMRGKFGERAEQISMAWIWNKSLKRRSVKSGEARQESFIYPRRTFEPLFEALVAGIEKAGGRVMIDRPAAGLGRRGKRLTVSPGRPDSFRAGTDPRRFEPDGSPLAYEAVVCCIPNDIFIALLDEELDGEIGEDYARKLGCIEYFTALNLVLDLERPLTDHYWVNVADRSCPFVGLIEHTNLVGTEVTGGRVISHVSNYLPAGHELLSLDPDQLLDRYQPGLRILNPGFERSWIKDRWLFREHAAQPIVDTGYAERIPERRTPANGLWLVNTTQIYPEDRGTNYAVRDGGAVAAEVAAWLGGRR